MTATNGQDSSKYIRAYVALGSNIDPFVNITKGINMLANQFKIIALSSFYETSPYGFGPQNNFLNLVIALDTEMSPLHFLTSLQSIESKLGRRRIKKNGPRTIDLDILLYGDFIVEEVHLVIPHQGLLQRDFMLIPAQEIAPHLVHPKTHKRLSDYKKLPHQHIIKKIEGGFTINQQGHLTHSTASLSD